MNEPTNPSVDAADTVAKIVIMDVLTEGAIKLALVDVPFLNIPVIKQLFTFIMNFAGKYLYKVLSLEAAFIIIGKQVEVQRIEYEKEVEQLKTAIKEGKSDEEINKERAEAKKRLRKLIDFNIG